MTADYLRAIRAATALLLKQRLRSLRIDVTRLQYDKKIIFDSFQHFCSLTNAAIPTLTGANDCLRDGCTIIRHNNGGTVYLVLYNEDTANRSRRAFTLAHEVGHIYLGHTRDSDKEEREANAFAAQLLAPSILVHELSRTSTAPLYPEDLSAVFSISWQAAENRLTDMVRLCRTSFSPEEEHLLARCLHLLPSGGEPLVDC